MNERTTELIARLEAVEEEINDMIYDLLRDAVGRGEAKRPAAEKRLTQARNAITKAIRLIGSDGAEPAGNAGDDE
jgi:hypothetical protein